MPDLMDDILDYVLNFAFAFVVSFGALAYHFVISPIGPEMLNFWIFAAAFSFFAVILLLVFGFVHTEKTLKKHEEMMRSRTVTGD